ncbi:histidine kinase [Streptomyces sp. NPDC047000]|uniref:sensor histidine kinase n=1 Tax=Streptomyces sp. NPDC047000 TaxID=3155474 RepID=UPI0033F8141B
MIQAKVFSLAANARTAVARWQTNSPLVRDSVVTVLLAPVAFSPLTAMIGAEFGDLKGRPYDPLGLVLTGLLWLPLALRRFCPVASLAVISLAFAARELLAYPGTAASAALYAALYAVGAHTPHGPAGRRPRLAAAAGGTALFVSYAIALHHRGSPRTVADLVLIYLILAVFWTAGRTVRAWRAGEEERRRLGIDAATAQERARIARELHDVVTHHVTAMVVQADAAQFLLEDHPDKVVTALGAIGDSGRYALTDLQHLLGVLKAVDGPPGDHSPVPGSLSDLVTKTRAAGLPVELTENGERRPMASAVELTVYRVVQESLTNALKHAPGRRTDVHVHYRNDELEIEVITEGTAASSRTPARAVRPVGRGGGHGLVGLRERVGVFGGELTAGHRPDGGFGVLARIPTGDHA